MLAFTLELMILLLIFRYILGYGFRVNRAALAVGIGIAAFYYIGHIFFSAELVYELYWVWQGIIVAVPVLLAQGKWATLLGVSLASRALFSALEYFGLGACCLIYKESYVDVNVNYSYWITLGVVALLCIGVAISLREKKHRINHAIESVPSCIIFFFVFFMALVEFNPWYYGETDIADAFVVRGESMIRSGAFLITGIVIMALICVLLYQRKELTRMVELNERCIKEQTEQYQLLSQRDQTLRKFRHDYNDHIHVMHALASAGKTEELFRYVKQLENIQDELRLIQTNHVICDALVNRYDSLCRQQKIELDITGKFPDHVDIPETGLCILLSNGLRNAYEAAVKCGEGGTITVELRHNDSFMFIRMTNPAKEKPNLKDGLFVTSKKNKDFHGYGVLNMIDAAEKAGGSVNWTYEETGYVITEIALPIINQA